ncbi:MAG: DNA methyltransferase [Calditrichia bacterium]
MSMTKTANHLSGLLAKPAKPSVDEEAFGTAHREITKIDGKSYTRFVGEFWTSRQRQASSLQEVSYRACFKPQLPRFFINRFSKEGDVVYDPFSGRGTTALESGFLNRRVIANDVNPLSSILCKPRFFVPTLELLAERLKVIPRESSATAGLDLSMFYHSRTEKELVALRQYLIGRGDSADVLDDWIRMVATNRLTGHSPGFFSVYTLPPNQAVSQKRQIKINEKRNQAPEYRDIHQLILKKSRRLINALAPETVVQLRKVGRSALFLTDDARQTPEIKSSSVQLTITSPPFLNIVQYAQDNWLRCWFNGIDAQTVADNLTIATSLPKWIDIMQDVFSELARITKKNGWVAFEVGEINNGRIRLDEHVVPLGINAGFTCHGIVINEQEFTKTANIWGVKNNSRGTNTNRIVLFQKRK